MMIIKLVTTRVYKLKAPGFSCTRVLKSHIATIHIRKHKKNVEIY